MRSPAQSGNGASPLLRTHAPRRLRDLKQLERVRGRFCGAIQILCAVRNQVRHFHQKRDVVRRYRQSAPRRFHRMRGIPSCPPLLRHQFANRQAQRRLGKVSLKCRSLLERRTVQHVEIGIVFLRRLRLQIGKKLRV